MAIRAARDHGVPFDEAIAGGDAQKMFGLLSDVDRAVQYNYIIDPVSEGFLLTAANAAGVAPNLVTAIYARHIAIRQLPDGHWITADARPPQSYSNITATAVVIRALQVYGHPSLAADTKARVDRAARWLTGCSPRSSDEQASQLLGLHWSGANSASLDKLARALKSSQRSDGGWAALPGRKSDAYSTGQVLVALHQAGGIPTSDPAWQHGIQFLLDTQAADGSWHVVTRLHPPAVLSPPYFESGYPYGHDQFVSAMGAAWAVQALAAALGPAVRTDAPVLFFEPKKVEPWVETALFGSAADLRQSLDKGLDPNAATASGGTTVLMMAQPDIEKTKLLLEHGAKVNARSKSKYSALLVASLYPRSPTVRLLLDKGAEVKMAPGAGAPLFNASPFILASFGGNAEIMQQLAKAGSKPSDRMMILGMFPMSPTANGTAFGDVATVRTVLDAGGDPNEEDPDGFTVLYIAVVSNRTDVARLLIARGANVNAVDRRGMTPLLYAASADFGDPSMVDLLLKSGANPAAKTKEGLTALDLARKYSHTYMFSALLAKR